MTDTNNAPQTNDDATDDHVDSMSGGLSPDDAIAIMRARMSSGKTDMAGRDAIDAHARLELVVRRLLVIEDGYLDEELVESTDHQQVLEGVSKTVGELLAVADFLDAVFEPDSDVGDGAQVANECRVTTRSAKQLRGLARRLASAAPDLASTVDALGENLSEALGERAVRQ